MPGQLLRSNRFQVPSKLTITKFLSSGLIVNFSKILGSKDSSNSEFKI